MSDEEREFRLRPIKPPVPKTASGGVAWSSGFRLLMRYARQSSADGQDHRVECGDFPIASGVR